jgi:hypothetical protein
MEDYKDLIVYQKAYKPAMDIFHLTKSFPKEEKYSRPIPKVFPFSLCKPCYRRRKYKAHFISKLTDCETENTETEVWIDFSKDCNHIDAETYADLFNRNAEVRKIIFYMINNPDKFM